MSIKHKQCKNAQGLQTSCYNKFFVGQGLHGDKTYNNFCLWKHQVAVVVTSLEQAVNNL
jgi:hypothetical protein